MTTTSRTEVGERVGPRRRGGGRRGRGEQLVVPPAEFSSYYGRPILEAPVWKVPDVPAYLYLGGLAGASAVLGALAGPAREPALRRVGRVAAAGAATASVGALIHDLGRPMRFLHMLRVFKPTSPLSVGSWILAPFSGLVAAAAASELTGRLPRLGALAGVGGAVLGPAMTTYTAALLADTAVPAWHEARHELPFVFAGSSLASAGGLATALTDAPQPRRIAVAGVLLEGAAMIRVERRSTLVSEVYRSGRAGVALRVARAATVLGTGAAVFSGRSRVAATAAGVLLNAGSIALRYGVFVAGLASARDPKYVVVPQHQRAADR